MDGFSSGGSPVLQRQVPPLANAKHEAVALAYLTDPEKIGWRAYQSVYPNSSRHAAETAITRLLKNAEFAARVAELAEQAAQGAVMKAQETLERISVLARDKTKGKEALQLRALELLCKHHGLFTDKKVHEVGNYAQKLIAALSRVDGPDASDDDVHRADTDERPPRSSGKVEDKGKRARP